MKMKRQLVFREPTGIEYFDLNENYEVKYLISKLQELQRDGATHVNLDVVDNDGEIPECLCAIGMSMTPETVEDSTRR